MNARLQHAARFAAEYCGERMRRLLPFTACCAVFAAAFYLYHLPVAAVVYPALVCALLYALSLFIGCMRAYDRHKKLALMPAKLQANALPAARTLIERDYQAIVRMMDAALDACENHHAARCAEMSDYYTAWAHQIKTPIASMRLRLQNEDSALSRELLAELLRVEQYVDMALMFLRLSEDASDYVLKECDIDTIVRQAVRRFSGEFILRKLRLDYEPINARALTDSKWLTFVVEQVLANALKYTPSGAISIYLDAPLTLCVRDTGIGIAREDLPRVFEKGYTGYNGRADVRASGIGLYLCRRVCTNLGHTITVESAPDEGTVVRIELARGVLEIE